MSATWDDERIARLVDKGGMEGLAMYGLYWRVQEIIASQMEGKTPHCSVRYTVTRWSLLLSLRGSLVFSTLSRLALTGLVTATRDGDEILVTNRNLLKYRDEYSKKSGPTPDNVHPRTEGEGEGEKEGEQKDKEQQPYPKTPCVSDGDQKEESERVKVEAKAAAKQAKATAKEAAKEELKKLVAAKKMTAKQASPPTKTDTGKARHTAFKVAIFNYWKSKNPEIDCPWQAAEGGQLEMWLKASPNTTITQFVEMLRNRYRSQVNHSERPSAWIKNITNFARGPVDRYNQKPDTGGNKTNGKIERTVHSAGELIFEIENSDGVGGSKLLQGGGTE